MLKIGFLDYYLDEWHANHYPAYLRECIEQHGYDAELAMAHAMVNKDGGISTEEWCRTHGVARAPSQEALVEQCDALFVLAPDNSAWHEELCRLPFMSGKPVYVDKTFAPDLNAAERMFDLAAKHSTPVFTSSAVRYCPSITKYLSENAGRARFMSTNGPHDMASYAVHQLDPINAVMGRGIRRLKCFSVGAVTQLILDYRDGRQANFVQTPQPWAEFWFMVSDGQTGQRLDAGDYYNGFMEAVMGFFISGIPPVEREDTMEVLSAIYTGIYAREHNDQWINLWH